MNKGLGLLAIGGAIFAAYKYGLFGHAATPAPAAAPAGGIVPANTPMPTTTIVTPTVTPPSAPATVPAIPPGPSAPAAGGFFTPAASAAASDSNTLLQQLQAASDALGDHQIQRNVDVWNALLLRVKPGLTVDDLSEVGIIRGTNDLMLAESYLAYRAQAGLSGYGLAAAYGVVLKRRGPRTMVHTSRRNYVRRFA